MKLIVTRPLGQAAPWVTQLQSLGVAAQALPLIDIEPLADPAPLRAVWSQSKHYALIVFVSANAVAHFFAAAATAPQAALRGWPLGVWAGSVGPGTTAALKAAGVACTLIVEPDPAAGQFDSEGLWKELQFRPWAGQRVLVVRGEDGRDWLADALRARGAEVEFVAAYRRSPPRPDAAGLALLAAANAAPHRHQWHFSSSEAIGHLLQLASQQRLAPDWSRSQAIAPHPRIVQTAREAGFGQVQQVEASVQAVADWLNRLAQQRTKQPATQAATQAATQPTTQPTNLRLP